MEKNAKKSPVPEALEHQISNAEWQKIESELIPTFGRVTLEIDEYTIDIVVAAISKLEYRYAGYVNGKIKGEWLISDTPEAEEIRSRFYRKQKKSLLNSKEKKRLARERKAIREEVESHMTYYTYSPYWSSFRSMKNHLVKNNSVIKLKRKV